LGVHTSQLRDWVKKFAEAPRFVGFALPWPISLNARQQFFFQPSPELRELLNRRLESREPLNLRPESIEELDDLAVLMTKRVETRICRH
jgi:hypothetical protein